MKRVLVGATFALVLGIYPATATEYVGKIRAVVCHTIGVVCQVQLNNPHTGAGCVTATSSWPYSFDGSTAVGKNILAVLLAAQASKETVIIGGLDSCNLVGGSGSEDLRHAYIYTP